MPTINTIANQARMVTDLSTRVFGLDFNAARNSALVGGTFDTLGNAVRSEFGGQPALNNLIESYQERREAFQEQLRENVDSLRDSADRLRETTQADTDTETATAIENSGTTLSTLGEFARGNIPPQENNFVNTARTAERAQRTETNNLNDFARNYLTAETTAETEDVEEIAAVAADTNEDARLNSVLNLVRDYNSTVNYLNENRGVSNRMGALANNVRNNAALNESLRNIGISVAQTGELTINETLLNLALNNDSEGVNEALGSEGLAGRLERDIDRANAQGERLFPNIVDFARERQEDTAESLYTANTRNTAAYAWENTGRLLSTMFT